MAVPATVPPMPYHPHEDDLRLFTWPKRKHSHSTWFENQPFGPLFTHHDSSSSSSSHQHPTRLISSHGDKNTIAPLFDVRESPEAYFLEGDFPGVSRQDDIKVEWTGNRTILVEANVEKVDLEREWGVDLTPRTRSFAEEDEDREKERENMEKDKGKERETEREKEKKKGWKSPNGKESKQAKVLGVGSTLRQWSGERHTGHFLRTFTFPHDVKQESLRARLGQGLLKMMVLKVEEPKENRQVDVEITEGSAIY